MHARAHTSAVGEKRVANMSGGGYYILSGSHSLAWPHPVPPVPRFLRKGVWPRETMKPQDERSQGARGQFDVGKWGYGC